LDHTTEETEAMTTALAAARQQRSDMSLTVPPEFERAIRERVESGTYKSPDDVFAACLKALDQWEDVQRAKDEKLRADIQVGIDQLDRGEGVDGEEALQRSRERFLRAASNGESDVQRDFSALGAEVQMELDRLARGEVVNQKAVLDRMRAQYPDSSPPDDEFFRRMNAWRIAERVSSGKYGSAGDVIHSALCWLEEGEADDAANDELRALIDVGLAELDRGEGLSGEEAAEQIRADVRRITGR